MTQYLTSSRFYFEIDGVTSLIVKKVSGPSISMTVAGGDSAIGVTKDAKTQTQATIGGVEYDSKVSLTYVGGNEADQQKLFDWYNKCHTDSYSGGGSEATKSRKTGSLVIYDPDGKEAMRFNFTDLFPGAVTQVGSMSVESAGQLAEDTLELHYTKVIRKV